MAIAWVVEQAHPDSQVKRHWSLSQVKRHWSLPWCFEGQACAKRAERALMGLVGLLTEFQSGTSAKMIVFALLGVRANKKVGQPGVAWILALEAHVSVLKFIL